MAVDTGRKTYVCWREWHQCLLMPVDSQPQNRHSHSPNWVTAGKAKKRRGSEPGKHPSVSGGGTSIHLPPWCRILPPTRWWTFATCRGVASYPLLKTMKNHNQQRNQNQQPEHKDVLTKRWGVAMIPPRYYPGNWVEKLSNYHPHKIWTAIDSIVIY